MKGCLRIKLKYNNNKNLLHLISMSISKRFENPVSINKSLYLTPSFDNFFYDIPKDLKHSQLPNQDEISRAKPA